MTVTTDYRVEVSGRIRAEFENGKDYYRYQGQPLWLPDRPADKPDAGFLEWHNEQVFR